MSIPTIVPFVGLDPEEDAKALRKAMKGLGTDEGAIIDILTNRTSSQRQAILQKYNEERDLLKDLKKELSGNFEDVVVALMTPMDKFLAKELHHAMNCVGTDENVLIEILCTRCNDSIREIKQAYEELYEESLLNTIKKETADDFEKLLIDLCKCDRDEGPPRELEAIIMAAKLYKAGEGRKGADEDEIRKILANESFATLRVVFDIYRRETGKPLGEVLHEELEGNFRTAMIAVYDSIQAPSQYFAEAIHKALARFGTDDRSLIRLLVSRSEIDLESVKKEYEVIYNKSLEKAIKSDAAGKYEKMLLALIKE